MYTPLARDQLGLVNNVLAGVAIDSGLTTYDLRNHRGLNTRDAWMGRALAVVRLARAGLNTQEVSAALCIGARASGRLLRWAARHITDPALRRQVLGHVAAARAEESARRLERALNRNQQQGDAQ